MSSMVATVPSAKKVQANRRNAQRFTGPRAQAGKNIVSVNAAKHGILSRHVVVASREHPEEYDRLDDMCH